MGRKDFEASVERKLDIVLPHSGGCFPYIAGRLEHSIKKGAVEVASKLKSSVRDYIRRFHYDSLAYYPETLRFMIELVGADRVRVHAHAGVECGHAGGGGVDLEAAEAAHVVRDLALQVGERHGVVVHQRDVADAGRGEVQRHGRAQAAGADDQGPRAEQALLALDADLVEQQVARIAEQVVVGHGAEDRSGHSGSLMLRRMASTK